MGRRVRTPHPLSLVRNSWKRAVKPCCTTRLWQVILLQEHAWLHSNNIGGSAKHNKVTKNSLKCTLSKNSLAVSEVTAKWATCILFPATVSFLLLTVLRSTNYYADKTVCSFTQVLLRGSVLYLGQKTCMYSCLKSLLCKQYVCA